VQTAAECESALSSVADWRPELVITELSMPHLDGLGLCRTIRSMSNVPIIVLSVEDEERTKVEALDLGADDYMTKPFSPRVLLARIRALLRRARTKDVLEEQGTVRIHEIVIHPGRHEVLINGEPGDLTYTEFRLLHFLARKPGWAFTRVQIVDAVKGEDYPVTERSVDVQVAGLRKKLGPYGHYIETVRGVGYRFKE
jgi:two-component system phosphate regulon response regulator PhoB